MKFCTSCGAQIDDADAFCTACGQPQPTCADATATETSSVQEESPSEANGQPAQESYAYQQPAQESYAYQQPSQEQPSYQQYQYVPHSYAQPPVPPEYKPLGAWGYFGYSLLFAIPFVGLICLIVFACGGVRNINLRNYARSFFCWLAILAVITLILLIVFFVGGFTLANIRLPYFY